MAKREGVISGEEEHFRIIKKSIYQENKKYMHLIKELQNTWIKQTKFKNK